MIDPSRTNLRPLNILLVEDNLADVILTSEALKEGIIPHKLHTVHDGVHAIDYLRRAGSYTDAIRPDVIVLDINLPKKNGFEVLAEIKEDPELRRIPVIVLTTSSATHDILRAYDLHANCYIIKPIDLDDFLKVVRSIEDFWFSKATLPER
jgi:two-component system, chemotaxis family, response regulator Rcp1